MQESFKKNIFHLVKTIKTYKKHSSWILFFTFCKKNIKMNALYLSFYVYLQKIKKRRTKMVLLLLSAV